MCPHPLPRRLPIPGSQHSPTPYFTPCRHLIPCFSLCSCLRLALALSSHPYVYYGHPRHRQFCSSSHVPCISILRFTSHTPHQASICTHPSSSTHIYNHSFHVHISPILCFSRHLEFFNVGKGDVLHRLISVSTFVGFPGWTFHRFPSGPVSLSLPPLSLQF